MRAVAPAVVLDKVQGRGRGLARGVQTIGRIHHALRHQQVAQAGDQPHHLGLGRLGVGSPSFQPLQEEASESERRMLDRRQRRAPN